MHCCLESKHYFKEVTGPMRRVFEFLSSYKNAENIW